MAIYSDRKLMDLVDRGMIISENFSKDSLTPNGYDLRIDLIRLPGMDDLAEAEIPPMTFFHVSTLEFINMPGDAIGEIWIRSTYARKGLIASFGAVDSGFHGNLTLSFFNASQSYIALTRGERIAQIIFHSTDQEVEKKYMERSGNYQDSRGIITESKNHDIFQ
ncbi:dCTP deaminase [Oxyplasma meridianum]|uniref:dCTP deaminase n=1 Tax=Oxyplasma meridianum TaxID=3073602 RepID=A0AAX4NGN7_9ARCH